MDGDLIIQLLGYLLTPLAGGIAWFFGKRSRNADETLKEQSALEEMQNTINSFAADNKKLYDEVRSSRESNMNLTNEIAKLRQENKALVAEISELRIQLTQIKNDVENNSKK